MNKKYILSAVILIATILISYSAYSYLQGQSSSQPETLYNLVDDSGHVTNLDHIPDRIISLAPSTTEVVFALGLDEKVVGVSEYCDYPYDFKEWFAAGNMTSIGDFSSPNMEVITSLEPDLILTTAGVQAEFVGTLRNLGYKVLVLNPTSINGVLQNIELVGNATGKVAEAKTLIDNISSRISAVVDKVANQPDKPTVYYEVWYDASSLWSAGAAAWQNEIIKTAGGINIFEDQELDYLQSSSEAVISRNPDIVLLPQEGMGLGGPFWGSLDAVKARPGWSSINAVQNDMLIEVDSNTIARAGPRVIDIIEDLAEVFHPDLF